MVDSSMNARERMFLRNERISTLAKSMLLVAMKKL